MVLLAFLTSTIVKKATLPLHLFSTGQCYFPGDCFEQYCFSSVVALLMSKFITSPLGGAQSIVMSMCLSVCLPAYLKNLVDELRQIFYAC